MKYIITYSSAMGGTQIAYIEADSLWKVYKYILNDDSDSDLREATEFIKLQEKMDEYNEDNKYNEGDEDYEYYADYDSGDEEIEGKCTSCHCVIWTRDYSKDFNYENVFEHYCTSGEGHQIHLSGKEWWNISVEEWGIPEFVQI